MQAIDVQDDIKNVLFSKEEINAKVAELAARIDEDYAGKDVLLVGVLKGAIMIMADLSRALKGPLHHGLDGCFLVRFRHQVLRRCAYPQGPGYRPGGPQRPDR